MPSHKLILSRAKLFSLLGATSIFAPLVAMGQVTTVFQDNFSSGGLSTLNPTATSPGTLTSSRTAYEIASSKNATGTTIASGVMTYGNFSTSSGYCEGQALFTASPVTLNTPGQYIEFYYTFTATTTLFNGNANDNEQVSIGLYNSGGSGPTNGTALWNTGLSSATTGDIGCTKGWLGYCGDIAYTKASAQNSAIFTRPAQTGANNLNQGLCPVSGYSSGINLGQISGVVGQPALTVGNQYTLDLKIYYASATTLVITNTLYVGAGIGGAVYSSGGFTALNSATATTANLLTSTFDALCIGFRPTSSPTTAETMQINNVTVLLVTPIAPNITGLTNETVIAGTSPTLSPAVTGVPTPTYQWYVSTDGGATSNTIAGATNATLALANVQYSQNNYRYSLVAANTLGTNAAAMTLSVIVPPSITGMNNQADGVGTTVTISPTVSGVPAPTLQWQTNGVNVTDGPDANGSTISGSTASTLTITGAQTGDSGTYSLIASNSAGMVTNSMNLTVSSGNLAPSIAGPNNTTVVQGSNATFSASASGVPVPALQWLDQTQTPIPGATNSTLVLTNVQYSQNGYTYYITASNSVGSVTNNAVLTVIVPPAITSQPASLVVTNTQAASFTVAATGAPAVGYQWSKNGTPISSAANNTATNATFTIANASPTDTGNYFCTITNQAGTTNTVTVTLTVDSTMSVTGMTPANGAAGVSYDTPLYLTFSATPTERAAGSIKIYNATNPATPVDVINLALNATNNVSYAVNVQPYTIGGSGFTNFPVIINGTTAAIYPHHGVLTSNQTYYVTLDNGTFNDSAGAYFTGISNTNAWRFTTKPAGPAVATNLVVAQDYSGDFATVEGALDSIPANNTTPTIINIRNGTYTEVVNVQSKHNITFRGQSRAGTLIAYPNNSWVYGNTHNRMTFKISANNIALDNLTVSNSTPLGGSQAEALMVESGAYSNVVNNCNVDSYQDTILANQNNSRVYFENSLIQGNVDFIWGGGVLFFTNCEIRYLTSGSLGPNPSPSSSDINSNGFSFVYCQFTAPYGNGSSQIGRTRSITNANMAMLNCFVSTNIGGWASDALPTNSFRNWYYNCTNDLGASVTLSNGMALASTDANLTNISSAATWFYGWQPTLTPNILTNPMSQTVTAGSSVSFTVAATGIPDPTYQWLKNGTNIPAATSATLTIASAALTDAGSYSVVVTTPAGSATSSTATLAVNAPATPVVVPWTLMVNTNNIINVTSVTYGAVGDGVTTNTAAIQAAINAAAMGGTTNGLRGGTVEIPASGIYLCGPLNMSNNVNLQIDAGAILRMLPYGSYPGSPYTSSVLNFISGSSLTNIEISGSGAIDGQGSPWWQANNANSAINRPIMIDFGSCNRLLIQNLTLSNSPMFHLAIGSGNMTVQGVTISAPSSSDPVNPSHNTDACDVGGTNILVQNCNISTGDDDFTCGGNTHGVLLTNNVYGTGHGVSVGSYTDGGVSNITVINCYFNGTDNGIRLKSERGRGGLVQNLTYCNLTMTNVAWPLLVYSYYEFGLGTLTGVNPVFAANTAVTNPTTLNSTTPIWQNITFSNITATAVPAGRPPLMVWGLPEAPASNIVFDAVNITSSSTLAPGVYNGTDIQFVDCSFTSPAGVKDLQFWDADLIITNTFGNPATTTNLWILDGLTTNGIGNALEFDNALGTLTNTNALDDGPLTLADSTFTVSNNLTLFPTTVLNYTLSTNATKLAVTGNLTLGGTNTISAGPGFTNGTYTLMTYGGTLNGTLPALVAPAGYNYAYNTSTPGQVNLTVSAVGTAAPVITNIAPSSATLVAGNGTNVVAGATGTPAPFYFWYNNSNQLVQTSASQTLILANVQLSMAGVYSVTASNSAGTASTNFTISVIVPPVITSQPTNQGVNAGQNASFSVTATGFPSPAYQWLKNGTNLAGQIGAVLTITNASGLSMGTYSVLASNSASVVTSSNAVLTVNFPTTQPTLISPQVTAGGTVQFSINSANGSAGFGYRVWASTNIASQPVTNTWTLLTNGIFGASPVSFTDHSTTNLSQKFYLITVP